MIRLLNLRKAGHAAEIIIFWLFDLYYGFLIWSKIDSVCNVFI